MDLHSKCPNCGAERIEGAAYCGNCGKPFETFRAAGDTGASDQPSGEPIKPVYPAEQPEPDSEVEKKYVAWEDRENRGFFDALWETWKQSTFYPEQFFSKLPYRGGIGAPLLYAIIVGWIGIGIAQIYGIFWSGAWSGFLSQYPEFEHLAYRTGLQSIFSFAQIFLAPVFIVVGLFVISGIIHLVFIIFGWGKRDFEATFRAIAYAESATIFMAVPACGGIISAVWSIVLAIIGLKHMQKTTGGKAALAYFLPGIVCCCLLIMAFFIMAMLGVAAFDGLIESLQNEMYY